MLRIPTTRTELNMAMKTVRLFVGEGQYKYATAIGDFAVNGATGRWHVYRGDRFLADLELLSEVDFLVATMVGHQIAQEAGEKK